MDIKVQEKLIPINTNEDELLLDNPDRGFRAETWFYVKEMAEKVDPAAALTEKLDWYLNRCLPERVHLDMIYIYLTDYCSVDIPLEGLEIIRLFFDICRKKKLKLCVRFSYCDDWQHPERAADQATILRHIDQLAPVVSENADVFHSIQSGFVGAYGEWAEVYQGPKIDYATVITAIVTKLALPNNLHFQIRLPEYKNKVKDKPEIYNNIGFNIDAFFGEQRCYGWESGDFQIGHPNGQWEQLVDEAAYTPQDGELFVNENLVNTRRMVDGGEAILELAHHRHTVLSCWHGYKEIHSDWEHTTVMGQWKKQLCTKEWLEENNIVYCENWFVDRFGAKAKRNMFQFVRDYLGYKLEGQYVKVETKNNMLEVEFALKNYGFSVPFNLISGLAILDLNNQVLTEAAVGAPTEWYSHSPTDPSDTFCPTYVLKHNFELPKTDNFKVAFYLRNTMGVGARLGNQLSFEAGYNILLQFS